MSIEERRRSYMNISVVLFIVFVLFAWASYKLVCSQMYYHVTVEQYVNDNQTITEAFKEETAMRRMFQQRLAKKKVELERQQMHLVASNQQVEALQQTIEVMQRSYNALQIELGRTKHEKDSLRAVIGSLRRAH